LFPSSSPVNTLNLEVFSSTTQLLQILRDSYAQYTPPTPTQLNCVLNSQLVGDSLDASRRVWTICRQRRRVASCRRCERTSRQSWPSFQFSAPVTYAAEL